MKKIILISLVICMVLGLCACNSDKIGSSAHKRDLNCPELENISNFEFDKMEYNKHYFFDKEGKVYAINFEKPFLETKTNAKVLQGDGYEFLLNLQASNNGWFEGSSFVDFLKNNEVNINQTVFFDRSALMFDKKSLKIYEFADIGERCDIALEANNEFRMLKEFDEEIISICGCVIKTETKYYAIEKYIVNADEVENYADAIAQYDYRVVELDEKMFAISMNNIKFLYMPDLENKSYFMMDKDNNCYLNKTYIGG